MNNTTNHHSYRRQKPTPTAKTTQQTCLPNSCGMILIPAMIQLQRESINLSCFFAKIKFKFGKIDGTARHKRAFKFNARAKTKCRTSENDLKTEKFCLSYLWNPAWLITQKFEKQPALFVTLFVLESSDLD